MVFTNMIDTLINDDSLQIMKNMPNDCVDLIIADPPYNSSKGGDWKWDNSAPLKGMGGNWNLIHEDWDNYSLESYFNFTITWLTEAKRILKPTGSIWIFGTYHNIGFINVACQILNIEIINEVIWYKRNAFPNLAGRRLTASHETLLWCHKMPKKRQYYFDYEYSKNGNFSYDGLKTPEKQMRTVWDISNNKEKSELKFGKHPTQKPLRILKRIIKLSSKKEDLIFTPFSGSGSECIAAKQLGRHYLGIEQNKEYFELSKLRIEDVKFDEDSYGQISLLNSTGELNE